MSDLLATVICVEYEHAIEMVASKRLDTYSTTSRCWPGRSRIDSAGSSRTGTSPPSSRYGPRPGTVPSSCSPNGTDGGSAATSGRGAASPPPGPRDGRIPPDAPAIVGNSAAVPSRRGSPTASAWLPNFRLLAGYREYAPVHMKMGSCPPAGNADARWACPKPCAVGLRQPSDKQGHPLDGSDPAGD